MSFRLFALLLLSAVLFTFSACSSTPPVRQDFADAAASGNLEKVKEMVENEKVDPSATDSKGYSSMQHASNRGYFEIVEYLGSKKANTKYQDPGKATALHHAAYKGHMEIVRYLVEVKGDDVNFKSNKGYTPLERASLGGHIDIVKFLISRSADPTLATESGDTPLHSAAFKGNVEVVKYLLSLDKVVTDAKDSRGFTALHYAVYNNQLDCVNALIEDGADVNAVAASGLSVLSIAKMAQNKAIIKVLEEKGAVEAALPAGGEEVPTLVEEEPTLD